MLVLTDPSLHLSLLHSWLQCRCRVARRQRLIVQQLRTARRQRQKQSEHQQQLGARRLSSLATSMAAAAAPQEPEPIRPQRRRIRGISGVSSTESASPADFPGAPVLDTDTDRQADSVVKDEADLEEDAALADCLNTALPGRHEDDREVAATQQDEEEENEDEGEEEEEEDDEEEEVAPRQAQVAPPPQEGVVDQGSVISGCLAAQARARRSVYKEAPALATVALTACVSCLHSFSPRHARRCRSILVTSFPSPHRTLHRPPVRQRRALLTIRHGLTVLLLLITGSGIGSAKGSRQTVHPPFLMQQPSQGICQTVLPFQPPLPFAIYLHGVAGTSERRRPGARLSGSAHVRLDRTWGYRGQRIGEASHPGPPDQEPPRFVPVQRVPVGGEVSRQCTIRLTPQGGLWIWIVHSTPPLRVGGKKTPAEALQKWLQKFQNYIVPASQAVLWDLHKQWSAHPLPPPPTGVRAGRRARSTPPAVGRGVSTSPPDVPLGDSQADSPPPSQPLPAPRRVCKKAPPPQPMTDVEISKEDPARQEFPPGVPPLAGELSWDQITDLARKPIPVERYLPRPCKGLFEQVMTRCLESMPSPNNPMPGIGDYIFILPKLLLFPGAEKKLSYNQKVKHISRNCQTALRGDWATLWHHSMQSFSPSFRRLGVNDDAIGEGGLSRDTARSLYAAAQRGHLGKAWKQLRTPPPMGITSEVWMQAKEKLCPLGDDRPDLPMFATPGDWQPTLGEFKKAVSRLKTGKALDLGGWSSELLQHSMNTPHLRDLGHQWVVHMAVATNLHARRAEMMHATKLVALDKGGGQLRPICVSTIWVKLISYLLLPKARECLDPHLQGHQFGVGTSQGATAMIMHIKAHLARFQEHVAVQLDFKNAFCTLHRQTCLEVVSGLLGSQPAWFQAVSNMLTRPTHLLPPGEGEPFSTYDGIPQGDPMSTLLFATAMTTVVRQAITAVGVDVQGVSYIDDTVLVGSPDDVAAVLQELPQLLSKSGLQLQPAKTKVWSPTPGVVGSQPHLRTLQAAMSDIRGLTILGEAVGLEPEDAYPVGEEAYVTEHIQLVADKLCGDIRKLRHLPGMCGDDQAGLQIAWCLQQRQVPSRILHLLRAHPTPLTDGICEQVQTELQENVRYWLQFPALEADQWTIAEMPITSGGLAFPNLRRQAVVARTACLATLPEFVATATYKEELINKERPELFGRLRPLMGPTPMEVLGDLHNPPLGKSFSRMSKKLTHFHYTLCCNELWAKRDTLPDTVRYAWMHNLPGSEPGQPQGFQGQGAWLRCLPRTPATTLPDCVFRWGLQQRLGCAAPGDGRPCARPGCGAELDPYGIHAASCNWGQVCKRHDRLRDHIATAARQAGMAAVIEQNMALNPDTPGDVRNLHRADVRIIENDGRQMWVDVKVITTKPKVGIKHALCQAEVAKCRQYGQGPPERHVLHGKMVPFVVEAHGKLAPMAETITSYLITRQAKVIEEKRDVTPSTALRQASEQFWSPSLAIFSPLDAQRTPRY